MSSTLTSCQPQNPAKEKEFAMRVCFCILLFTLWTVSPVFGASERNALFDGAQSHWLLGENNKRQGIR